MSAGTVYGQKKNTWWSHSRRLLRTHVLSLKRKMVKKNPINLVLGISSGSRDSIVQLSYVLFSSSLKCVSHFILKFLSPNIEDDGKGKEKKREKKCLQKFMRWVIFSVPLVHPWSGKHSGRKSKHLDVELVGLVVEMLRKVYSTNIFIYRLTYKA